MLIVCMCVHTSEDVPYDAKYAVVEDDEVEEELDEGADIDGRVVCGSQCLLDDLGQGDEEVPRCAAEVGSCLITGINEAVAGDRSAQEQHRQDVNEPHLLRPDDQLLLAHLGATNLLCDHVGRLASLLS